MILLALDPGTSTGYALARINTKDRSADIFEYGYIDIPDAPQRGTQYVRMMEEVRLIFARFPHLTKVGIEDYFVSGRFVSGVDLNYGHRAAIAIACEQDGVPYETLNISNWKIFAAGRSTPTKEQKMRWGKAPAKKLMMVQALYERWGIKLPNHSISASTGKPIEFRYDIVDAICQVMYLCFLVEGVSSFTCSVPVSPDVAFKRPSKKRFDHSQFQMGSMQKACV